MGVAKCSATCRRIFPAPFRDRCLARERQTCPSHSPPSLTLMGRERRGGGGERRGLKGGGGGQGEEGVGGGVGRGGGEEGVGGEGKKV